MAAILASLAALIILAAAAATIGAQLSAAQGQQPLWSPCPRAIKINTNYQYRNSLHFVCLQATSSRPRLDVIHYFSRELLFSREVDDFGTNQLASFVDDEGSLRILLAVPNRINGTSMYSLDRNGRSIMESASINTQYVSSMSIWKLELNWEWQLAIANQPTYEPHLLGPDQQQNHQQLAAASAEPRPMISIFSWRSTYFDSYQLIYLPQDGRVTKLEPMYINGQEFLIVAMESGPSVLDPNAARIGASHNGRRSGHPTTTTSTESLIYKLDFGDGSLNWIHYQFLKTKLALDVRSFVVTHQGSLQKDYYIAVLGQKSDIAEFGSPVYGGGVRPASPHLNHNNRTGGAESGAGADRSPYGLIIYKYFGDQFVATNSIPAPSATKLDTISYGAGDSYVIIALLSEWSNQISLYLFDGLTLRPMPAPFNTGAAGPPQLPPAPVAGRPQQLQFSGRPRRTMDSANLHLFMVPPTANETTTNEDNGAASKRTLVDEDTQRQQIMTMPALAFSNSDLAAEFGPNNNNNGTSSSSTETTSNPSESVYRIPVNDIIPPTTTTTATTLEQADDHLKSAPSIDQPAGSSQEEGAAPATTTAANNNYAKRNYVGGGAAGLLDWCRATINSVLADDFERSSARLLELPRIDQREPIELSGDLIIEDDLSVSNILYANRVLEARPDYPAAIATIPSNFSHTFEQIQLAHMEIDQVQHHVQSILVDDGTIQEIFNPLIFDQLIVECPNSASLDPRRQMMPGAPLCPHVDEIRAIQLNGRNISNIRSQALITGRPMRIDSDVRFEHLVLKGSVEILETLNGLYINDIVFKRGPAGLPIVGHKNFTNGLYSSSKLLVEQWQGVRGIDRDNYLVSTGPQHIEAPALRVSQIIIDSPASRPPHNNVSSRIEKLNGLHLDTHLDQIALTNGDNTFEVPVHFDELILNGPVQFTANSRLSSIDLEDLWLNTMFKHSNQNVTAPIEFSGDVHVSYGGDILVDGPVNGIGAFGPDVVMMKNRDQLVPNPVVFERDVSGQSVRLAKALNGIQVAINSESRDYELAILYNGGTQYLTGDKVLNNVHLGGNSHINGNINGHLNLTELYDLAHKQGHTFVNYRLSGQDIRLADKVQMHIGSTINGVPANDICSLANRLAQQPQQQPNQYNRLRFEQPVHFKSLRCASINGFNNLTNTFLARHGNQHVAGTLRLANGVVFNTTVRIQSTFNQLNVAPLSRAIAETVNENRTGHKEVYGDLFVDELFADQINDLRLSNVFLAKADWPQLVRAPMVFDHLDIENVLVVRQLSTNSFNGINITDILTNTLQYDAPQVIFNHVELNNLQVLPQANFLTSTLNGHQLRRLYADAVLVDAHQQILAPKVFRSPVEFTDRLFMRHGVDGLTSEQLRFNLLLHSDELIDDDLEFNNDVLVKKELEIQAGIINEVDIRQFVDSMLYENRPGKSGMIIVGNGSVRFRDVKVNNLVVAGLVQGLDLSREALLKNDNANGTFDARIREQQLAISNQRLINSHYGPGSAFRVYSPYEGGVTGNCYMHSCPPRTTFQPPPPPPPIAQPVSYQTTPRPPPFVYQRPPQYQQQPPPPPPYGSFNQTIFAQRPPPPPPQHYYGPQQQQQPLPPPPIKFVQQFYPNIMPKPFNFINTSVVHTVWKPNWETIMLARPPPPPQQQQQTTRPPMALSPPPYAASPAPPSQLEPQQPEMPPSLDDQYLIDPGYWEHKSMLQAQAIKDLSYRVNKYLSISYYYEIIQKHPLLGPLLHSAKNPILNEEGRALLLLKGTSKPGEPCLQRGQTVAVMAQQRHRNTITAFTQSSRIQETSNPSLVDSIVVGPNHFLFILDTYPELGSGSAAGMISQVMVYFWDYKSGMYELKERLPVDGSPTSMRAFTVAGRACVGLAIPKVTYFSANYSGPPILFCQPPAVEPLSPAAAVAPFSQRFIIPIANVFDLDIVTTDPRSTEIIIAALSQQDTEQIGDLNVNAYDVVSRSIKSVALRRMVRPLKLHFLRPSSQWTQELQLVVSEAISSNDDAQAVTRIFSLKVAQLLQPQVLAANSTLGRHHHHHFYESQIIKDNQFYDIQSVQLDGGHSMLFFQSAHSISIYAPLVPGGVAGGASITECDTRYSLVQRLPTKGANRFLVFNDHSNSSSTGVPFGHFLVLSKDDCEQQQYTTLILKARFK